MSTVDELVAKCKKERNEQLGATPCQKTGVCFDCNMADTMCNYILTIRRSKPIGKIKVILVGEEVGF